MHKIVLGILAFLVVVVGITYAVKNGKITNNNDGQIACTMEAKLCPDGSYVGREGPLCEFAECPATPSTTETKIKAKLLINEIYITPQELLEDSRCAVDVTCIWAGQVRLKVDLSSTGNTVKEESVILTTGKPFVFNKKVIELVGVSPEPNSKTTINLSDYIFTFRVTDSVATGIR